MPLNYDHLMGLKRDGDRFSYTDRETMLYALGQPFQQSKSADMW